MNDWLRKAQQTGPLKTALAILIIVPIFLGIILMVFGLWGALFLLGLDLSNFYPVETIGILNSIGVGIVLFVLGVTIKGLKGNNGN